MERSKASFLLPVLLVGALVLVLAGARKPDIGAALGSGKSGDEVKAAATALGSGRSGDGEDRAKAEAISWMTIEQAEGKLKEAGRPLIIDLYTNWCGWCKQMDRKTYSNKQVAAYLQEKFYTVKMDAETRATINWAGKTYNFNSQYRASEFALYLTHGRLEFPTTIFIVPGEEPQAIPGYMEPKELEILVKYFGEGEYKTTSFDVYQKKFRASW